MGCKIQGLTLNGSHTGTTYQVCSTTSYASLACADPPHQPRIQQIYASLGVLDDIHAWTQGIDRIAAHGSGKEILAVKEFVEYAPESPGTPYVRSPS